MIKPNFITEKVEMTHSYGKFILSPLPAGFGHTLGNSLRRTLLSCIEGVAVTYVKINDVVHPFSTIEGVKESVLDIILNLKLLRFKTSVKGSYEVALSIQGKRKITGGDFKGGDVEVVNKNQPIADITSNKAKLDIKLLVETGMGYSPTEEKEKKEFGLLAIDSVFSPVVKVNFSIEEARVGRKSNYDKLILEIWTDGSLSPEEALKKSGSILTEFFRYILSGQDVEETKKIEDEKKEELANRVDDKIYKTIIDELDLPTRVINALLREKIETIEDLVKKGKEGLVNLKGVGKKSLDLIKKELEKLKIPFN